MVSTRSVAIKISEYFKKHNIGRVQCIILDEINAPPNRHAYQQAKNLTPLINGIKTSEALLPMFKAFTRSWWLAKNKNIALTTMKDQRRRPRRTQFNVVTIVGERFFGSGEIRSALAPHIFMKSLRQNVLKVSSEKSHDTRPSESAAAASSSETFQRAKQAQETQLQEQRQSIRKLFIAVEEVNTRGYSNTHLPICAAVQTRTWIHSFALPEPQN